jgi:hypothetical protein
MDDLLEIPAFLRGSRPGPKPRKNTPWRMSRACRPAGEPGAEAEKWLVQVDSRVAPNLASGWRLVWVTLGRKWAYVRDNEAHQKMAALDWHRMSRTGKIIAAS